MKFFYCHHVIHYAQASLLTLLFAFLSVSTVWGQPMGDADSAEEGIYAVPIGNPTIVWAAPSTSSRELARLDSAGIALETVGRDTTNAQGELFEEIRPRAGSGLSWESGYVLASQLRVGIDRPRMVGLAVYGSLSFSSAEPSTLSLEGFSGEAQNIFGGEGRSPMGSIGVSFKTGRYIPPGDGGLWFRLDGEYALLQSNPDAASNVSDATATMVRAGLGGEYIYQASPDFDFSIGALVGGGPVYNDLTLEGDETLTVNALFGTADALVGVGYGRNVSTSAPGTFRGLTFRLEGGYRFGRRLGDWGFAVGDGNENTEDEELSGSLEVENADQALSLSGPVLRLSIGL